jgi:DNA gyrase inhibitor GyrI
MRLALAATLLILLSSPGPLRSATAAADDKPVAPAAPTVGEMRIQTLPALSYLYLPAQTTFAKMGEPVKAGFDKLFGHAAENKFLLVRPTMLVYQGNPHFDPQKEFKMEMGIVVGPETPAPPADADVKLRKTEPFKCATILYTGTVMQQGQAYQKLIPALKAANHTPTGEVRVLCLYWDGMDSPNNVFMLMIGIK